MPVRRGHGDLHFQWPVLRIVNSPQDRFWFVSGKRQETPNGPGC